MKEHRGFLWVLALLPLLVSLDSGAYAQSTRNPERDLGISFSRETERTEFGAVYGEVENKSANTYPCVRVQFNIYEPFVRENVWGRHLGVVSVEVRNVLPRSTRKYHQPFTSKAPVIVLKSVSECPGASGPTVTPPASGVCKISVVINNDSSTYQTTVWLQRADGSPTLNVPRRLGLGRFSYINVPEGGYKVVVKGKYPPGEGRSGGLAPSPDSQPVQCRPNGSHRAIFKIDSTEG